MYFTLSVCVFDSEDLRMAQSWWPAFSFMDLLSKNVKRNGKISHLRRQQCKSTKRKSWFFLVTTLHICELSKYNESNKSLREGMVIYMKAP